MAFSAGLAGDSGTRHRHSDRASGNFSLHADARLQHQRADHVRPDSRDRFSVRRRHRGGGKLPGADGTRRTAAEAGGHQMHEPDHRRDHRDHAGYGRLLCAAGFLRRHGREYLHPVRDDHVHFALSLHHRGHGAESGALRLHAAETGRQGAGDFPAGQCRVGLQPRHLSLFRETAGAARHPDAAAVRRYACRNLLSVRTDEEFVSAAGGQGHDHVRHHIAEQRLPGSDRCGD